MNYKLKYAAAGWLGLTSAMAMAGWAGAQVQGQVAPGQPIVGQPVMVPVSPAEQTVLAATNVLVQSAALQGSEIPPWMLADAQAVAIVPNLVRGAFVIGVQHGRGVILIRDGQGAWQSPRMIQLTGGSIGYQIGVQSTDLVLVFRTQQSVANLLSRTIKIGVDASAAAGPVGRQASAATDLPLRAEILSYSRARGAFVGVSIDGSSISIDPQAEATYYQPPGAVPASAVQLIQILTAYSSGAGAVLPAGVGLTSAVAGPPSGAEIEAARQQLDAVSRQLAAGLDDRWKQYLALPADIYVPNQAPSAADVQQAVAKYEDVARRGEYAALVARAEFQGTLQALRRLAALQQRPAAAPGLPPPPAGEWQASGQR